MGEERYREATRDVCHVTRDDHGGRWRRFDGVLTIEPKGASRLNQPQRKRTKRATASPTGQVCDRRYGHVEFPAPGPIQLHTNAMLTVSDPKRTRLARSEITNPFSVDEHSESPKQSGPTVTPHDDDRFCLDVAIVRIRNPRGPLSAVPIPKQMKSVRVRKPFCRHAKRLYHDIQIGLFQDGATKCPIPRRRANAIRSHRTARGTAWKTPAVEHHDELDHHDHEAIVELTRLAGPVEVSALIAELQAKGIKAISSSDDLGGIRPNLTFVHGYRVLVFENDVERAQRVLHDLDLD
jgi:hypothetical protein